MGSLQDQLVEAGLASKSQAKRSRKKPKPRRKQGGRGATQAGSGHAKASDDVSLAAAYAARAKDEKLSGKRQQMEDERRRKINIQLKGLIEPAAQNKPDGQVERYLEFKGKIRKLYVTQEQQDSLSRGDLGVVYLQGRHFVVAAAVIEQVRAIQAENISLDPKLAAPRSGEETKQK